MEFRITAACALVTHARLCFDTGCESAAKGRHNDPASRKQYRHRVAALWSLLALFLFCCTGQAAAAAIEYSCTESGTAKGMVPRVVKAQVDLKTETVTVDTSAGPATGLFQTTLDLYVGRIEAKDGKVFILSIHRFTGRISLLAEQPSPDGENKPEFVGACTAK